MGARAPGWGCGKWASAAGLSSGTGMLPCCPPQGRVPGCPHQPPNHRCPPLRRCFPAICSSPADRFPPGSGCPFVPVLRCFLCPAPHLPSLPWMGDALQHWDVPTPSTPGQGCPPALGCSPVPIAPQNRDILCYWDITVITRYRDILPVPGCSQDMDVPSSTEIPGAPARGWCPRGGGAQLTLVFCPRGWSHCCVT